ncbi:hypothetical protein [Calycomorphotria hydatis]|uniref:Uncharacterized protein n=1 Tax=Calycomorphotria hydatis TaxID=2528027 RepID=A0A517TBQ8_9PLAN|nr:hypothetical protein [Calycomorphotria hydatis]QDT65800.1 hypothetical protein V22_30620 [Calycomorphotria hydatis]
MSSNKISWEVNHLRLTAFTTKPLIGREQEVWQQIFDVEPENTSLSPRKAVVVGVWNEKQAQVEIDPVRVNIRLFAQLNVDTAETALPTMGQFSERVKEFADVVSPWIRGNSNVERLAFGGLLMIPADNHEEAYALLQKFIGEQVRLEGAREFQLRINRRRTSNVLEGIEINRLCKWFATEFSIKGFMSRSAEAQKELAYLEDQIVASLDLDINNVGLGDSCVIPEDKLEPLFEELVSLGEEIAEKGDVD